LFIPALRTIHLKVLESTGTWHTIHLKVLKVLALGIINLKVSALGIVHPGTWHYLVKYQQLAQFSESIGTWHYSLISMWHAPNHKQTLIFLKSMVNGHKIYCFHEFSVT